MSAKLRLFLNYVLKFAVLLISVWFLITQFQNRIDINEILHLMQGVFTSNFSFLLLFIVLFLMIINWSIEIYKWNWLCNKIDVVPLKNCIYGVLSGTTISMFMPNRTGDFAARILWLKSEIRWQGVLANYYNSLSLVITTFIFGFFSLFLFPQSHSLIESLGFDTRIIIVVFTLFIVLAFAFYFKFYIVLSFFSKLLSNRAKAVSRKIFSLRKYRFYELLWLAFVSSLRFLVYSLQFYLLLWLFGLKLPFFVGIGLTAVMYLLITVVPQIAIAEIATRAALAILVFETALPKTYDYSNNLALILASSSTILWLINLFIPAIIGLFVLPDLKFFKTKTK